MTHPTNPDGEVTVTNELIDELVTRYFGAGRYHFAPSRYRAFARELLSAPQPAAVDREAAPVEVWHGERKVTIYEDCVLRVWGANIESEMSDAPRTLQTVQDAMDWLYAAPLDTDASKPDALDRGYVTALIKRMQDYCDSLAPPMARRLMAEAVRALVASSPTAPSVEQDERGAPSLEYFVYDPNGGYVEVSFGTDCVSMRDIATSDWANVVFVISVKKEAFEAARDASPSKSATSPTPSAIEATAALIANGLVGQASEEDVREVERLINELLGVE
jgi:hypothetical protein